MRKKRTLIIAEAGVNHNGDVETARALVKAAKECGADVVKFQTFNPKKLASKYAAMAAYQKDSLGMEVSQEEMLSKLTLRQEDYVMLAGYCKEIGIGFLSTPFDIDSISFLNSLQDYWKVPSGEITNYPYLVEIAKTGKDIILSTGMSTLDEVDSALNVLRDYGAGKITLLHCTTDYPASMKEVNLQSMVTLKHHCGCEVGYSDHTLGIEVPIAAVAMGAAVIEKHFTLDRDMAGPDHKASMEPQELERMIKAIRNVELALGDGEKRPSESERANMEIVRKSITAARDIKMGEMLTEENLTTKRPGMGLSPMRWKGVIGTKAKRDFLRDEMIEV